MKYIQRLAARLFQNRESHDLASPSDTNKADHLNLDGTIQRLSDLGLLDQGERYSIPSRMPKYDDEVLEGFSIFRKDLSGPIDLSNLLLPRTFISRSGLTDVSFMNTELSQSSICWNDFIETRFDGAKLDGSDIRASIFKNCSFTAASLRCVDLRHSTFSNCRFDNADLAGAIIARDQLGTLKLTKDQSSSVDIRQTPGTEPDGG